MEKQYPRVLIRKEKCNCGSLACVSRRWWAYRVGSKQGIPSDRIASAQTLISVRSLVDDIVSDYARTT